MVLLLQFIDWLLTGDFMKQKPKTPSEIFGEYLRSRGSKKETFRLMVLEGGSSLTHPHQRTFDEVHTIRTANSSTIDAAKRIGAWLNGRKIFFAADLLAQKRSPRRNKKR
jgi:hypothetical protein